MIDPIIKERLEILNPEYANFLKSDAISEFIKKISTEAGIDDTKSREFSNGVMLYLLFFLTREQFITFIHKECAVSIEEANKISSALLSALPEDFENTHKEAVSKLSGDDLEQEITDAEDTLKAIPHIHTMAQDMIVNQSKDEITYSSTQAAILNEAKPKDESADRWGSENK